MDKKEESARNQTFSSSSTGGSYDNNEDFNSSSLLDPSQPSLATKWCSDNEQPLLTEKEDETKKRKFSSSSEQAFDSKKVKTGEKSATMNKESTWNQTIFSSSTTIGSEALLETSEYDTLNAVKNYSTSAALSDKNNSTNNPATTTLNPVEYKTWTKEQVCSLLVAKEENGGANLSVEDVKPLYDAGFKGTSLANIILDLKYDTNYAIDEVHKSFTNVPRDVIKSVVFWVDNLLKTRLYHLWSKEDICSFLCTPKENGGAGLNQDSIPPNIDGKMLMNVIMKKTQIQEPLLKKQVENILEILYSMTILTIDIPVDISSSLTDLLNGMTKLDLDPCKYKFVNHNMHYVQRKEALNTYLSYTTKYLNVSDPKAGGASVLFIGASPGVGKSRFAFELPNYLKDYYTNNGKYENIKMINLAIWFSNGANLDPSEEIDSNKKPLDLERSILARMIYSYIVHINPHSWYGKYITEHEKTLDSVLLLKIYNDLKKVKKGKLILQFLQWVAIKEQEEGKKLWIHFTLDEYNQLLLAPQSPEENSVFEDFLDSLSSIQYGLPCIFTNLLSGTHMHDEYNFKSQASGGKVYLGRIELLNFDENEQEEIYSKQNYPLTISKKTLFYSLGGHARLIELFGEMENCSTSEILQYLYEKTGTHKGAIRIGLELDDSTLEILIALCISRKPISIDTIVNGKTLKELQRVMILFFLNSSESEQKIVYIPIIILLKLIKHLVQNQKSHFLKMLNMEIQALLLNSSNFDLFEQFNQIFLQTKLNCLWLLKKKEIVADIQLKDIFPCTKENCMIATPPNYTTSELLRHQFPVTSTESMPLSNVIYKNGKGAPFADLFTILESTDGRNIFCYIQVRHTVMVTCMSDTPSKVKILGKEEELAESTLVSNAKEILENYWKENMLLLNLFITNRPVANNVSWPTIASNSYLAEYYGPFSIVVSYLGCVKMEITEINQEDFAWIVGSKDLTAFRTIVTNWAYSTTEEEKVNLLLNNLGLYQLKQLLLFTHGDDEKAVMEAINIETQKVDEECNLRTDEVERQ